MPDYVAAMKCEPLHTWKPFIEYLASMSGHHQELIPSPKSAIAARSLQHNISKPAQRRDDVGADVAIVARIAETLRPAGNATHLPRNRAAPTLTMQELLVAKAGRLMSV